MASKKQTVISRPLARTENVVVESVGDETVVYDTVAHVAHALTRVAAAVFAYADGKNTAAEIAELASYRLDTTVTEADVLTAIEVLDANSLLDGPVLDVQTGISRRTALKTFAAAGAGSMLVMSIATSAAQACITCSTGQIPPPTYYCSKNTWTSQTPSGPVSPSGWVAYTNSDCRLCNTSTGSGQGVNPCQTTGSTGHCCCTPCDGSSSHCCQPICIQAGSCPSGTLPLGHTVGGYKGYSSSEKTNITYPQIVCPSGYGAYQTNGYAVKCCETGTSNCECVDSIGTCGYKSGNTCIPYT